MKQVYQLSTEQANIISADLAESIGRQDVLLKQFNTLFKQIEASKTNYQGFVAAFKKASENLSSSEKQNASLRKELDFLIKGIIDNASSFEFQKTENLKILDSSKKILKQLDEFDTVLIEMTVRDELKHSKDEIIKEVKSSIKAEMKNQKLKWSYLLASGLGLYLLGAASFYIVNYIVMGVK